MTNDENGNHLMKTRNAKVKSRNGSRRPIVARRLLVPVDFSDSSLRALRYAADLAAESGASLTIVHVVAADYGWLDIGREEYRDLDKALQKQAAGELRALVEVNVPRDVSTDLEVRIGRPAEEIVAAAGETKSDLIILSTQGRTGLDRYLIGSVAERVARLAPCAVYLMRPGNPAIRRATPRPAILRLKHKNKKRV